jgi:hypothetical protein
LKAEDYSDEKIPDKDSKDRLFVEKVESLYTLPWSLLKELK